MRFWFLELKLTCVNSIWVFVELRPNKCLLVNAARICRFSSADIKSLEGPLKLNTRLDNAERLFEGNLIAPEHLLERDGVIYAAVKNNRVVKIVDGDVKVVTSFGRSCCKLLHRISFTFSWFQILLDDEDNYETFPCGRPLGMAFDVLGNNLIVIHSSLGVFEVNLENGEKKVLVSDDDVIGEDVRILSI